MNNNVMKFFKEISTIPRTSGKEEKICKYIIEFAIERNLKYVSDEHNNVIVFKSASEGYENHPSIILQSHTDMICVKTKNSTHDFEKDPIELVEYEDYIKAKDTTLGADDGIGVAIALSILDDDNLQHPDLEVIFTTEEETTMNGVKYIDLSMLKSNRMIGLDNMYEDELWIGCASCHEWNCLLDIEKETLADSEYSLYTIDFYEFAGGHSGLDIGRNVGNPILLMAELLKELTSKSKIYINSIDGGTRLNVIPTRCKCDIFVNDNDKNIVEAIIAKQKEKILEQINNEKIRIEFYKNEEAASRQIISEESTKKLLEFLTSYKNGVQKYDEYGNVTLSSNFGVITSNENNIQLDFSMRSNEDAYVEIFIKNIEKELKEYNIRIINFSQLPGYEHKGKSEFLDKCEKEYIKFFDKNPKLIKMHVALEAGFFNQKIKDLDFVAIAPNIWEAHSPNERVSISSVNKVYEYITILLAQM